MCVLNKIYSRGMGRDIFDSVATYVVKTCAAAEVECLQRTAA